VIISFHLDLQFLCGQILEVKVGSVLFQPKILWVSLLKESGEKGKRVKISHGRATVKRFEIWDLGFGIASYQKANPKSQIPNPKSNKSGNLSQSFLAEIVSRQDVWLQQVFCFFSE